ncbi:MAG: glycosyltransferase family 9 protein [Candidatus Omnitrophota bacterium]
MKDIKTILLITLNNLGDIILTTPVLERLSSLFPEARIDVITGEPGKAVFSGHHAVREVNTHRRGNLRRRVEQIIMLRKMKYDVVVDLKNSLLPYLAGAKYHSGLFRPRYSGPRHKVFEHLSKLSFIDKNAAYGEPVFFIPVTEEDRRFAGGITSDKRGKIVIINPGAKSHLKRWPAVKYAALADRLISELKCEVIITGNEDDKDTVKECLSRIKGKVEDLSCKTTLGALYQLMKTADLVITNDSAPLHVAGAAGTPVIALFGPTDEKKYGPLSRKSAVIKPPVPCRPCGKALCGKGPAEGCIAGIESGEVLEEAKRLLQG